jgi:hypothetical protein
MATLVDLTNQMEAFAGAITGANSQADKLLRTTGSLVEVGPPMGQGPGRLSLTRPEPFVPTIGASRGFDILSAGFQPGLDIGPTFVNYAYIIWGRGATGYEESITRAGIQGG